jgi:hypothetical protein
MTVRNAKANGKRPKKPVKAGQTVQLTNPVSDHFKAFIVGNAFVWQTRALVEIQNTMEPEAYAALVAEFELYRPGMAYASSKAVHDVLEGFGKRYVVQEGEAKGQTLALCGAGPTLRENAAEYCAMADQIWGCNSAVTWLADNGHRVTHGFTVDQTEHMAQEWGNGPDVEYLIASTIHPELADVLRDQGKRYRYFHNFVGIQDPDVEWADVDGKIRRMSYEDWLYASLFPPTQRSGSGLNSVTRALDIAHFMGFGRIYVLGADCSLRFDGDTIPKFGLDSPEYLDWLRNSTMMHANGGSALASEATPVTMSGEIDGRVWLTKPDMAISATWLVKMAQKNPEKLVLVGDTLPNAILNATTVRENIYDASGTRIGSRLVRVDATNQEWMPNFVDAEGNLANLPV